MSSVASVPRHDDKATTTMGKMRWLWHVPLMISGPLSALRLKNNKKGLSVYAKPENGDSA
jgi:hypothetical protein